jgi:hypothetical protein
MQRPLAERIPFVKIVVVLAVTMAIGIGLCGVGLAGSVQPRSHGHAQAIYGWMLVGGTVGFWGAVLLMPVVFVVWLIVKVASPAAPAQGMMAPPGTNYRNPGAPYGTPELPHRDPGHGDGETHKEDGPGGKP